MLGSTLQSNGAIIFAYGKTYNPEQKRPLFTFVLLLTAVCILLCVYWNGIAVAQVSAGSITAVDGIATVAHAGRSLPAALAMKVFTGDTLTTGVHSSLTVALDDGSRLILSESSSFVVTRVSPRASNPGSVVDLLRGHLRSIVHFAPGEHFEVHTPNASIGVRGTNFETAYIQGKPCPGFPQCLRYTDVGVYKGVVEVHNPTSTKPVFVRVAAGYETTVPCEMPPAAPSPLGMGAIIAPTYH